MSRYARIHGDEAEGRVLRLSFLLRLWPFVRPYRRAFAACLGILALSFALELTGPWLVRLAVDGPLSGRAPPGWEAENLLLVIAAAFLAVTLAGAWLGYLFGMWTAWNGQRVVRDVRRALLGHMLGLPTTFYDRQPAGKLTTRITTDVQNLNELIATGVLQTMFDLLKVAGVLGVLFFLDVGLALFTLGMTPLVAVLSLVFRRHASEAFGQVRNRLAVQNGYGAELVAGIRATRAFGQEDAVRARYAELNRGTADAWRRTVFQFSLFFALVDGTLRLAGVGALYVGGRAILGGTLEAGEFLQFWMYHGLITAPLKELGEKYNVLQAAFASADRIFGILDQPRFPPAPEAPTQPLPRDRTVAFEGVSFAYHPEVPVLRDVSLVAPPDTTVAVVGPTGAGKSTLLALLSRLHDPGAGRVTLGGVDLRRLDVLELRRRIGVVPQDLFLFTGTVLDNVRLFDPTVREDKVRHVLEKVGALEFVHRLPGGLHAAVDERGVTFSQGERQLLAFARALVVDPDILVLDEATASMDSATEARLQRALRTALTGRTAFVVAHRLSTVRTADQILVLHDGTIVERGTHEELASLGGSYTTMLRA